MERKHYQTTLLIAGILMILGQPAAADLVQYWPMNDGATNASSATAANLAVGGNVGQLSAGGVPESWVTTGLHGPLTSRGTDPSTAAMRLDSSFFDAMDGGDLGLNSTPDGGQVTISMWINPVTLTGDDRLFGHTGPIPFPVGPGGHTRIAGGALEVWPNDLSGWQTLAPENTIVTDSWQHLALMWNYGRVTAYVNGVETGETLSNFNFDSAGSGSDPNQNFGLGNRFNLDIGTFGNSYNGLFDDVAIWNTGLRPANITLLAGGTVSPRDIDDSMPVDPPFSPPPRPGTLVQYWPLDDTVGATAASGVPTGNQGTLVDFNENKLNNPAELPPGDWIQSDIPAQLVGHSTGALDFEGNDNIVTNLDGNFVNGGNIGLTSDRDTPGSAATVSLWFKPRTLSDDVWIFNQAGDEVDQSPQGPEGGVQVNASGAIAVRSGAVGGFLSLADPGTVVVGEWHHLGFVWDGDEVTAYVNGVEQLTAVTGFNYDASLDPNQEFGLGRITNNVFGITPDGIFDDVSIWDGFLTAEQILELATGTSPLDIITGFEADFDGDGDVDGDDFLLWQTGFPTPSGAVKMDGDYDNDGDVDGDDFLGWQAEFPSPGEGNSSGAVPEPTTIGLLFGLATIGILFRRSRFH